MTTTQAPDMDTLTANIRAAYDTSTTDQRVDGMRWYDTAHALAVELDPANPLRAAGIISAISPRMSWEMNVRLARKVYADGGMTGGCLGVAVRKADAIYHGADVLATLKAPKTMAFATLIADPANGHDVVIDRHAMSVAYGRQVTDDESAALSLKGRYELFADAYRKVAAEIGVSPAQVQAITWIYWRETHIRVAASVRRAAGRAA